MLLNNNIEYVYIYKNIINLMQYLNNNITYIILQILLNAYALKCFYLKGIAYLRYIICY